MGISLSRATRLTNRERARIQSFPDNFEFVGSTTEVRRQIGNAVPPQGVYELAKSILPIFSNDYEKVDLYERFEKEKNVHFQDRLNKIKRLKNGTRFFKFCLQKLLINLCRILG